MKYQPLNDVIDPDIPVSDGVDAPEGTTEPEAPNDDYVIGENGNRVVPRLGGPVRSGKKSNRRQWVMPAGVLLAVLCVGLTIWNIARLMGGPPPPDPSPFQVKQALYMGVMKVEAYRRVHTVTPNDLQDVGLTDPPYSYRRVSPTEYAIGLNIAGQQLEFSSRMSMHNFFGSPKEMLAMRGAQ